MTLVWRKLPPLWFAAVPLWLTLVAALGEPGRDERVLWLGSILLLILAAVLNLAAAFAWPDVRPAWVMALLASGLSAVFLLALAWLFQQPAAALQVAIWVGPFLFVAVVRTSSRAVTANAI
jgi:hypothetical protein